MSFINRKIPSKATFALLLTATVLVSCSSNDSSSTGRIKNSAINGRLCYYDDERANLLLSAVPIEGRPAVEASPAGYYTGLVYLGPTAEYVEAVYGVNSGHWIEKPKAFKKGNFTYTYYEAGSVQGEVKPKTLKQVTDWINAQVSCDSLKVAAVSPSTVAAVSPSTVAAVSPSTVAAVSPTTVAAVSPTTVAAVSPTTVVSSSGSASSGPALPVCIKGAEKDSLLAGYDEQIKLRKNDADSTGYNNLLASKNNVLGREICTGTEVSKVVIVAVQTQVDQPPAQASVPAAVLTVEKPVVLLNEAVSKVVVAPTEVQELVAVAGFVEGAVEVQVENADGLNEWLVIDPASSNTVALGDGAKSIKYRVTSKDTSQPVVVKTVEIARLSVLSALKVIEAAVEVAEADQLALNPTLEVEKSSGSKTVIWVAILIMLLIVILVFGMQKKKKDDANSNTAV